jgi:hypothetical protein
VFGGQSILFGKMVAELIRTSVAVSSLIHTPCALVRFLRDSAVS